MAGGYIYMLLFLWGNELQSPMKHCEWQKKLICSHWLCTQYTVCQLIAIFELFLLNFKDHGRSVLKGFYGIIKKLLYEEKCMGLLLLKPSFWPHWAYRYDWSLEVRLKDFPWRTKERKRENTKRMIVHLFNVQNRILRSNTGKPETVRLRYNVEKPTVSTCIVYTHPPPTPFCILAASHPKSNSGFNTVALD